MGSCAVAVGGGVGDLRMGASRDGLGGGGEDGMAAEATAEVATGSGLFRVSASDLAPPPAALPFCCCCSCSDPLLLPANSSSSSLVEGKLSRVTPLSSVLRFLVFASGFAKASSGSLAFSELHTWPILKEEKQQLPLTKRDYRDFVVSPFLIVLQLFRSALRLCGGPVSQTATGGRAVR
jgi:hypothetical protein